MNIKRTLASTLALVLMTNVGAPAVLAARADDEDDIIAGLIIAAYLDELDKESRKSSRKKSSSSKKKSSSNKKSTTSKSSSSSSSTSASYSVYEVNPYAAVVRTSGGTLNMRERANSGSEVIKGLPNGASVTVTANTSNGWLRVVSGNATGFVHGRYIVADQSATQSVVAVQATAAPAAAVQATAAPATNEGLYYVIANPINNFVNMRAGTDTSTKVIGVYYYGTALKVIAEEGEWTKVEDETNGKVGYIKANQLQRTDTITEEDHG